MNKDAGKQVQKLFHNVHIGNDKSRMTLSNSNTFLAKSSQMHFHYWKNLCISIRISLKFVPWDTIHNTSVLVQVMAWRRTGTKPLPDNGDQVHRRIYAALGGDEF